MKYLNLISIFLCFYLPAHAQQTRNNNNTEDNDNWEYFYDIGIEKGLYICTNDSYFSSGSSTNLHGSYFFNDKLGFRYGISLITELDGSGNYWKMPLLFSVRTRTFQGEWGNLDDCNNFGELFLALLFHILPTRLEANIGTSLGYMTPDSSFAYSSSGGKEVLIESSDIHQKFASSIDANLRLSFQFWRICVNGNMGINYLCTKNFNHYTYSPVGDEKYKPCWFANLSIGASFRF